MPYYNQRRYYSPQQNNLDNLFYNVGIPTVAGLAFGPLFGFGLAALLSNSGQNTNIININTNARRNDNDCEYYGFQ